MRDTVAALGLALSTAGVVFPSPDPARVREQVRAWRQAHEASILREFAGLLAVPNLASDAPNIRRNAERIVAMVEQRGLSARLLDGQGGPPPVYGELRVPGAVRTVLVYAHYDGQPVDPTAWASPPWTPVLREGPFQEGGREVSLDALPSAVPGEWRLYARSAGDDKAPIVGVLAAVDALKAAGLAPTVNLKLFFEGEEEAGSPHMAAVLDASRDALRADLWLICDGPVHQSRRMQVFFGARGETDVEVTVYGPARALHSGHYGNWAPTRPSCSPASSRDCATRTDASWCPASTTTCGRRPTPSGRRRPRRPTWRRRFGARSPWPRPRRAARGWRSGSFSPP
ncbi:MAG: hypothetical protein DMF81_00755 [Acidobacteria bacterium]|nr:MAG: hypothetical protein DMF81_00755 [Acidobacteriota bacterium]